MAQNKTQPTTHSVEAFLHAVKDETKRKDSFTILSLMKDITGEKPVLWGPSLVGFGKVHYTYKSGRSGDWFLAGFSPRVQGLTLYITGFDRYDRLMQKLGKYKTGKSCLYIKRLSDIDIDVLKELIIQSAVHTKTLYKELP